MMAIPSLLTDMQEMLKAYEDVIQSWLNGKESLDDPYETEYRENYAPANAAVVLAYICRFNASEHTPVLLQKTVARSLALLQDKSQVNPFCRVFLYHYSLMAILVAPEKEQKTLLSEYSEGYSRYTDDCNVINTNCAALQWAMELFTDVLGIRDADHRLLDHRLTFISSAQLSTGFINDEVDTQEAKDGMPIAYHAFTLFILNSALTLIREWPQALLGQKQLAEKIVDRGMGWLEHAVSSDGTMAMAGRSSHQMFTWGALVALIAGRFGRQEQDQDAGQEPVFYTYSLLEKAFAYWLPYKHKDGTYSCTPNFWPHTLRVGYENYTHLNMYNLLGLTGIVVAANSLSRLSEQTESANRAISNVPLHNEKLLAEVEFIPDGMWIDSESGYAFYRRGEQYFGCTLRMHHRQYAPAMQVFHIRHGNQTLPLAEARLPGLGTTAASADDRGVWEGYLAADTSGHLHYPDSRTNVSTEALQNGVKLCVETDSLICDKTIRVTDRGIEWMYSFTAKIDMTRLEQVVPIIVHNGLDVMTYSNVEKTRLECLYAGSRYTLHSEGVEEIQIDLNRSFLSPSGVVSKARLKLKAPLAAGETLKWTTTLEVDANQETL